MALRLIILIPFLALTFMWQTDWFSDAKSWQQASGYDSLPAQLKPSSELLTDDQPQIFWLGHAGFFISWRDTHLLLDPNLSTSSVIVHRAFKQTIDPKDLPNIDAALISHAHSDHLDMPTLEQIPTIKKIIVPSGSQNFLSDMIKEKSEAVGLRYGEKINVKNLTITAVTAIHNGSRYHPFTSEYHANGYIISDDSTNLYFAGDTGYGEHFKEIKQLYAPKIAILPIAGYQPYFILKNYHLSPEDAVKAALELGVETTIPCHFATFRIALDPIGDALPKFAKVANEMSLNWRLAPEFKKVQ